MIHVGKSFVCLQSVNHVKLFKQILAEKMHKEARKKIREGMCHKYNLQQSILATKDSIVVLDELMNVKLIFCGAISELSATLCVPEGTIKASLHKTAKKLKAYLSGTIIPKPRGTGFYFIRTSQLIK